MTADDIASWLSRLVRIPSVNPAQAGRRSGTAGEGPLADQLASWFSSLGAQVETEAVQPGRPNVYGIWRGRSDRWVAVDVHTDTVSVETMDGNPFSGDVRDGRVWGRGAVDTKATLAIVLAMMESLHKQGRQPEPNVIIAATIDEEVNMLGALAFARWLKRKTIDVAELAVAEPTGCGPVFGHKGVARFRVRLQGTSVHSAQPELGHSAIVDAARAIDGLTLLNASFAARHEGHPLGRGTLTVTMIEGGSGINLVPDTCVLTLDRRLVDGETIEGGTAEIRGVLESMAGLRFELESLHACQPFFQDPQAPWVARLAEWAAQPASVAPYGTNASAYADLPAACVVIGPGSIDQAHRKAEWVDIAELERMASIYARWWGLSS